MGARKEDVAGEQNARVGCMHERVAARVRGANLDQRETRIADAELELAAERVAGELGLDAVEVERAEAAQEELSELAHLRSLLDERGHRRGRQLGHLRGGLCGGDDARSVQQLV